MMLRALEVLAAGNWDRARRRTRVALDFDRRNRRRLALTAADGLAFLLDLPKARHLRAGDGLVLESGEIVEIEAAPEPLLELSCDGAGHQVRLAWHLGNRHIPTELRPGGLRIRADHVLAEMARLLGARVTPIEAAFDPEGGAYEGVAHEGGGHHHAHHHDDDHAHPHEHDATALGRSTWR